MSEARDTSLLNGESSELVPVSRRSVAATLLSALGSMAFLQACKSDAQNMGTDIERTLVDSLDQQLTGTSTVGWVDTIFGLPLPIGSGNRSAGELATSSSAQLANATVVVARGAVSPGDGGGGVFIWQTSGTDDGGTVIVPNGGVGSTVSSASGGGCWQRLYTGPVSVRWFGAVGNGSQNDHQALQHAVNSGASEVFFPSSSGSYKTESTLTVGRSTPLGVSVVLTGDAPGSATIQYTGTGYAVQVNGTQTAFVPGGPNTEQVHNLVVRNLKITATSGSGMFLGTTINPLVLLENVTIYGCAGYALELAQSVYFATLRKCAFGASRGVKVTPYCDLFTVDQCSFGDNVDYDLDIECPTFHVANSDFELNRGSGSSQANILLRTSAVESGYGTIRDCRFGPETPTVATNMPRYDIHILRDVTPAAHTYRGCGWPTIATSPALRPA